jgi:hypothetical protein
MLKLFEKKTFYTSTSSGKYAGRSFLSAGPGGLAKRPSSQQAVLISITHQILRCPTTKWIRMKRFPLVSNTYFCD